MFHLIDFFLNTGVHKMYRLAETKAFRSIGASPSDLFAEYFPPCTIQSKSINAYWTCRIEHYTQTMHHPTSTCRMGAPDDPTAVVDPQLRFVRCGTVVLVNAK